MDRKFDFGQGYTLTVTSPSTTKNNATLTREPAKGTAPIWSGTVEQLLAFLSAS